MSPKKYWDVRGPDVPREFFPTGRVRISLRAELEKYARPRREALQKLRRYGEWDVIRSIADGRIDVAEATRLLRRQADDPAIAELRARAAAAEEASVPTIASQIEAYLEHLSEEARPKTVAHRRYALGAVAKLTHAGTTIGELPVHKLEPETLRRKIRGLSDSGNTREGVRGAWSGFYTWLLAEEDRRARAQRRRPRFERNPAKQVEAFERKGRPETASDDQVRAILAHANVYQEAYVRPLLQLGFRQGELRHTRLHVDLELESWAWRIRRRPPTDDCSCRACRSGGWKPKTKRSRRTVIVPEGRKVRSAIVAYLDAYPAEEGDFVFRRPDGRPWTGRDLGRDFRRLCEQAGVKYGQRVDGGITLHTLRHTCATNLIRSGVDSSIVAAILGDTVQTVVKQYIHLMPEDLAKGVAKGPAF